MNGFDLQSVGWVLFRDLHGEAIRVFFGEKRRISAETLDKIKDLWGSVCVSGATDQSRMSFETIMCRRRAAPLSKESENAMKALLEHCARTCPDLYGEEALRKRRMLRSAETILFFVFMFVFGHYAPASDTLLGQASVTLFLLGLWHLIITFQLWMMHSLMKRLNIDQPSS